MDDFAEDVFAQPYNVKRRYGFALELWVFWDARRELRGVGFASSHSTCRPERVFHLQREIAGYAGLLAGAAGLHPRHPLDLAN
jgi:hypothetical protein